MADEGTDILLGYVHQGVEVGSGFYPHLVQYGGDGLDVAIAAAGALALQGSVQVGRATLGGGDGVAHAQPQVVVGVDADGAVHYGPDGL